MRAGRAPFDADEETACARIPVRRPETRERGHEVQAVAGRDRSRERLGLRGVRDDPESVSQPLDGGAGDERTAFDRVPRTRTDVPGDGRDEPTVGPRYGG